MSEITRQKLLAWMEEKKVDAFFVSKLVNVRYVSGYTSDDAYLLLTRAGDRYFLTDPRYTEQVSIECPDYQIVEWRKCGSVGAAIGMLARQDKLQKIAFEEDDMVYQFYSEIRDAVDSELIPVEGVIEEMRSHKTAQEIEYLTASCQIAADAYEKIIQDIHVGITEKELAAKLSLHMVELGSDTMPYGNILISGARTSLLHGIPSAKAIEYGDFVLMDYGCQYKGYLSDMTRTLVVGKATDRQKEVYRLEQEMVKRMEEKMRPGATSKEVYDAGADVIRDTEYFQYHYTGVGHGIGMFVHEMPFLGPTHKYVLSDDTVMTCEPGIYIPGWGGVRIEDTLLIGPEKTVNLTPARKELIEL